jgi:hypothetical protein
MPIRDFIPEGEEKTPAERAAFEARGGISLGRVRPDFIPGPEDDKVVDRTEDEKNDVAREAAVKAAQVDEDTRRAYAKEKLAKLSVSAAIDFIEGLSPSERERFVKVERDNRQRIAILKRFHSFPDDASREDDPISEPPAEGDVVGKDGDADTPAGGETGSADSSVEAAAADAGVPAGSVETVADPPNADGEHANPGDQVEDEGDKPPRVDWLTETKSKEGTVEPVASANAPKQQRRTRARDKE